MQNYKDYSQDEKKEILHKHYIIENKSLQDIAEMYGTYPNKIRRDAKKFDISLRSKSEAQKNALKTGKHKHPTKGQKRSDLVKEKIGSSMLEKWESMDKQTRDGIVQKSKQSWENRSQEDKQNMLKKANQAVRKASREGSKLEKFLLSKLLDDGYRVDFHQKQILSNTKLEIDLFLPEKGIAIEVDGPSHFDSIWGQETLTKNQKYDSKKTGLILGKGLKLIRIKQNYDFSKSRSNLLYSKLKDMISSKSLDSQAKIDY